VTVTHPRLAEATRKIRSPRCEDCRHCKIASHYEHRDDQLRHSRCQKFRDDILPFAADVRDDPKRCGPKGKWFEPKAGAAA